LTVAKATKKEFDRVWEFVRPMEALFDNRDFFSAEEEWRSWPDDDEDKKLLLKIEKEIKETEGTCWDGNADNRLVLYEFIKKKFLIANHTGSIGRILYDCETLIDNVCDPKLDYIEFKPSIMYAERNALEKVEKIILKGEQNNRQPQKIIESIKKLIEKSKK
jgi:hypothetical protein